MTYSNIYNFAMKTVKVFQDKVGLFTAGHGNYPEWLRNYLEVIQGLTTHTAAIRLDNLMI